MFWGKPHLRSYQPQAETDQQPAILSWLVSLQIESNRLLIGMVPTVCQLKKIEIKLPVNKVKIEE
jgi:hypothetical protein